MLASFLQLMEKLCTLAAQFFIYRAGQHSVRMAQQQETLNDVEKAKQVEANVRRLDDNTVLERLRQRWRH